MAAERPASGWVARHDKGAEIRGRVLGEVARTQGFPPGTNAATVMDHPFAPGTAVVGAVRGAPEDHASGACSWRAVRLRAAPVLRNAWEGSGP